MFPLVAAADAEPGYLTLDEGLKGRPFAGHRGLAGRRASSLSRAPGRNSRLAIQES